MAKILLHRQCSYNSTMIPVHGRSLDPRQAVHLNVALFKRGEMIQFCGEVRVLIPFPVWFFQGDGTGVVRQL